MKKFFAVVVAIAMVVGISTVAFAGPKGEVNKKDCGTKHAPTDGVKPSCQPRPTCPPRPTMDPNATPRPTCPPKATHQPRPTIDPNATPKPTPSFTVFEGTTTAKAFVRISVGKKTLALHKAKKDGTFSIKVSTKKIKGEVKVEAFILTKVKKHHWKKEFVVVTLTTPAPVVTPEPTPVVTPEPVPEVTPEPAPEVTPEPVPEVIV